MSLVGRRQLAIGEACPPLTPLRVYEIVAVATSAATRKDDMDDPATFIAAVIAAVGVVMFLVGLVMFVWGVATLGDTRTARGLEGDSSFWEAVKEILKKCLSVAFNANKPLAERRLALGFLLMLVSCALLLSALGVVAADALTGGDSNGDSPTDTTNTTTTGTTT